MFFFGSQRAGPESGTWRKVLDILGICAYLAWEAFFYAASFANDWQTAVKWAIGIALAAIVIAVVFTASV